MVTREEVTKKVEQRKVALFFFLKVLSSPQKTSIHPFQPAKDHHPMRRFLLSFLTSKTPSKEVPALSQTGRAGKTSKSGRRRRLRPGEVSEYLQSGLQMGCQLRQTAHKTPAHCPIPSSLPSLLVSAPIPGRRPSPAHSLVHSSPSKATAIFQSSSSPALLPFPISFCCHTRSHSLENWRISGSAGGC
jgi:hypothetical protein